MIKQLLQEHDAPNLIWFYKGFLDDILPKRPNDVDRPEGILDEINRNKAELELLNGTPLEVLIQQRVLKIEEWNRKVKASFTAEEIAMKNKAAKVVAQIEQWKPEYKSSQYLRNKVMERIKNDVEDYFDEIYGYYEWGEKELEQSILNRKVQLEKRINELTIDYPIAVEYHHQKDIQVEQLKKDLALLGTLNEEDQN